MYIYYDNHSTYFSEICHGDILILKKERRLHFTAKNCIRTGEAAGKS